VRLSLPRVVVAGLAGDVGKSLVTLGLARALCNRGRRVAPFKKGPDFIDAAWLGAAARAPGRNLDTYLMTSAAIAGSLQRAAQNADLALVEGNRGLFDGADAKGSHSTAQLARLIGAPIVLVVNATKVTRTIAAQVLGCRALDPSLPLAGVILNRVATSRQEDIIRQAIGSETGVLVLGAIPRLEAQPLPSRHLGLVCASEHPEREDALEGLAAVVAKYVDVEAVGAIAAGATSMPAAIMPEPPRASGRRVRIGVLRDAAFSFYYPENLEALEAAGAELVPISPLADDDLPAIDGLYAGGGFPEEHAAALAANQQLRAALAAAIGAGLPVWAECGGLMYLSRGIVRDGQEHAMVGALPVVVEHTPRPQGHGYVAARVDGANPFIAAGTHLAGHEFHYSRLADRGTADTVLAMERGVGLGNGRDGLRVGNVVATYTHLHALGTPEWALGLVQATRGAAASEAMKCRAAACLPPEAPGTATCAARGAV
jgi:cobyrinic acid a,c-diamide synthase